MIDPRDSGNLALLRRTGHFHIRFVLPGVVAALQRQSLLLFGWLLLVTPVAVQVQFYYTVTNQTVIITGYSGTNVVLVIPDTITGLPVTAIGDGAFSWKTSMTSVTIPNSVTSIGSAAFGYCTSLKAINVTFGGIPTALWTLPYPLILTTIPSFGVRTNQYGFIVSWATNLNVVVEAATDLANPIWSPLATNVLSGGTFYFSDSQWTNYQSRFYRVRWQ